MRTFTDMHFTNHQSRNRHRSKVNQLDVLASPEILGIKKKKTVSSTRSEDFFQRILVLIATHVVRWLNSLAAKGSMVLMNHLLVSTVVCQTDTF